MHTILIDGNNWGFAGMSNPRLSSGEKDTQAIFSVLHKVRNVIEEYQHSNVIVLWDGKSWRKDIYSEYKANREKTEKDTQAREAYYEQKKDILAGLELLGVRQLWGSNMEADDMAAILSDKFSTDGHVVTLMTADKDWQQLVRKNVKWVDNINLKMCDIGNFERVTGFKDREQFIEAKCILGDAGDNIKGINGIGPKALEGIYKGYSSFAHFLTQMDFGRDYQMDLWKAEHGKVMPKVLREIDTSAAWVKVKENLALVDLHTLARPKIEKVIDTKGKLDAVKFNEFCERNAFHSIRRNMDAFLEGFKQNPYVTK